jgi:hypothetical protein
MSPFFSLLTKLLTLWIVMMTVSMTSCTTTVTAFLLVPTSTPFAPVQLHVLYHRKYNAQQHHNKPTTLYVQKVMEDADESLRIVGNLNLDERFDRWRFLQQLLDEEIPPTVTNQLLYHVLQHYVNVKENLPSSSDSSSSLASPERTALRLQRITDILKNCDTGTTINSSVKQPPPFIPLLCLPDDVDDNNNNQHKHEFWIHALEDILPDPIEEEDAYKGTWDTVIELHGREAVKYNQLNPSTSWQANCLAARILIYYDFL